MESVILKPLHHRGQESIGIYFSKNAAIQSLIQKKAGGRWSRTHTCWYIPLSKDNYQHLAETLSGKVVLQNSELKKYLLKKKSGTTAKLSEEKPTAALPQKIKPVAPAKPQVISPENEHEFIEYKNRLLLKGYSPSTVRTYCNEFHLFLQVLKNKSAKELAPDQLQRYILYCINQLKLSENTVHSRMNALKFYYEQVLHKEKMFFEIPRPKKPDQLPKVLGENEIGRMFNSVSNLKHKAILFTAYSAGLRVSEVINLKIQDVDSERMQLFVEKSKGKKDRYVGLSILLLDVLRAYIKSANPRPVKFVFENPQQPGESYSIRSAQQIFHDAKKKAKINKDVGIHSLRHSFATHLLEKGIDIRYIKDLLGHFSIKTTERYLHVKKETLINIPNVLDELNKSFTLDW